jgi:hypothetical protein
VQNSGNGQTKAVLLRQAASMPLPGKDIIEMLGRIVAMDYCASKPSDRGTGL